jgi:predicted choloylglycine hydrolase
MHKLGRILLLGVFWLYIIFAAWLIYFTLVVPVGSPRILNSKIVSEKRVMVDSNFYYFNQDWLQQNKYGLWEMYLEGDAFDRGVAHGKLCADLNEHQEAAFVKQIYKLIPSKSYLYFLRDLIAWFNRDIQKYIPQEYLDEINGISQSADAKYDFIGPAYHRILNYHAAHDIGHALQNLALVGCTSFALNENSSDKNMIIGRNFDFYVNDDFAKNKIVAFVKPLQGHKFVYITWASFIGVVSGMNDAGLTVTINAAKSTYPTKSADPISLIAREILQYAENIEEAKAIAKKRQSFVSESFLIGSAADNRAILIEKTPSEMDTYSSPNNSLVCANHFQGKLFLQDSLNVQDMRESPSVYRENRCKQLIAEDTIQNYLSVAATLRDMRGMNNANIGMGNEKAMNQLISHHSVIFLPHQQIIWVSTSPYQLGTYVAYDLKKIFADDVGLKQPKIIYIDSLSIAPDSFLYATNYQSFKKYKQLKSLLQTANFWGNDIPNIDQFANELIESNPKYYYVYKLLGDYYFAHKNFGKASNMYLKTLDLEIEHQSTKKQIEQRLAEIQQK